MMVIDIFFSSWDTIFRIIIFAICGYFALVIILRTTGQRTLAKLNAFDFIVTVAIGSAFASFILSSNTTVVDGITAMGALVGLQLMVSWLTVRSDFVKKIIKNEPRLLYYNGQYIMGNMKKVRMIKEEIEQSVRLQGYLKVEDVNAVILETDGRLSIISTVSEDENELPYWEQMQKDIK